MPTQGREGRPRVRENRRTTHLQINRPATFISALIFYAAPTRGHIRNMNITSKLPTNILSHTALNQDLINKTIIFFCALSNSASLFV